MRRSCLITYGQKLYTAVYILNRCPTKALRNKTPFEAYSTRKPGVAHLKVFGSVCFVHKPKESREKLDAKSTRGVFVGYATCEKGYRVFDPVTRKLLLSRDIVFDEGAIWNWKEATENSVVMVNDEEQPRNSQVELFETLVGNRNSGFISIDSVSYEESSKASSRLEDIQNFDHAPLKWRKLDDILAQCNLCTMKPEKFEEAVKDESWMKAMKDELNMIEKNDTWELVDRSMDKPVIGVKWVFKTKLNLDGSVQKNKARLVAKGYSQKPGVDYNETFAPVARLDTIRTLIALAAQKGWQLYQLDVKSAFRNGILEEEVYVDQLEVFVVKGSESKVYKLHKALYGLKQAPRAWYSEIDGYFAEYGFTKSQSKATLYVKARGEASILIVSIYVDDIVYTGNDQEMIEDFKKDMKEKYEMTDLGLLHHFLGMGVIQTPTSKFIHQKKYATTLLSRFGLNECKPVSIPLVTSEKLSKDDGSGLASEEQYRRIVGSLLYLTATRPNIMFATSLLARFMHCPTSKHLGTAKHVLRYVKGILDYGLEYVKGKVAVLIGYCDSDWSGSVDDSKSTSGYAFSFGSGVFAWASVKQNCVALATAEAEYISASEATTQAIWLRFVLEDFGELQTEATPLHCDNISAIAITRNPVFHQKTKDINRRYHFIKDALQEGTVDLICCPTNEQLADIFTKALAKDHFCYLREKLGVKSAHNLKGSVEIACNIKIHTFLIQSSSLLSLCFPYSFNLFKTVSSCGNIHNISYPFRLNRDPEHCGDSRYTLHCDNNVTVLHLHSGKYMVLALNYDDRTIRVVDPGLEKNNCSSIPRYPVAKSNFSMGDLYDSSSQSVTFITCAYPVSSSLYVVTAPCINNLSGTAFVKVGSTWMAVGFGGRVQYRVDDYDE
ncbi:hypothetical protein L3X38_012010 [Prunus dulcis]|uniref:Multidrug resistance-associated protein 9 n=1 Tax=Prunus dulcis TaxID=3755 RepID=A0AAD4WIH4_PRUDU|nr:hypothetical protein L3X38_012010 [Prunus dulcis]